MYSIAGSQTEKNLLKAFAGESQAKNRYEFFAKQARKEGLEQIAALFEETALNEKAHAKRFFNFLEGGMVEITASYPAGMVGSTLENLQAAADGENEEWTELYPEFARVAEEEGFKQIAVVFKTIAKIEQHHEARYRKLYQNLEEGKVFEREGKVTWKCRVCGFLHESAKPPKKCPACEHEQAYFELEATNY
ncbi:rubrerythrin [Gaoshiqia sediminis]|uniref:Rubrerythrin family protein n=1 Tax=Gaoshiqia sediminis TaxID=2986998 RepID=A0AA42C921_9BACT|nr:rubrerythrin family protein [Gaoshiqia sediminis]MCW0483391.1 rubrerythrin family protein [Gaoshiqia sediminis]